MLVWSQGQSGAGASMTGGLKVHTPTCIHRIQKGESNLFSPLCLRYGVVAILPIMYGGELLHFQIWRDHSVWSVHINIAAWFAVR